MKKHKMSIFSWKSLDWINDLIFEWKFLDSVIYIKKLNGLDEFVKELSLYKHETLLIIILKFDQIIITLQLIDHEKVYLTRQRSYINILSKRCIQRYRILYRLETYISTKNKYVLSIHENFTKVRLTRDYSHISKHFLMT